MELQSQKKKKKSCEDIPPNPTIPMTFEKHIIN